mmetsp:Transcript_93288/g.263344  ORF Transcript_93288/g.263344 Transcript_93288/m.263344 type:complete len:242 (+) Transcript_93288:391-1116(+)
MTSNVSKAFRTFKLWLNIKMSFLMPICSQRSLFAEKTTMRPNHCSHGPMPSKVEPSKDTSGPTINGMRSPGGNVNLRATPPTFATGSLPAAAACVVQPLILVTAAKSVDVSIENVTEVPEVTCCSNTAIPPSWFNTMDTAPLILTVLALAKVTSKARDEVTAQEVVCVVPPMVATQFGVGIGVGPALITTDGVAVNVSLSVFVAMVVVGVNAIVAPSTFVPVIGGVYVSVTPVDATCVCDV